MSCSAEGDSLVEISKFRGQAAWIQRGNFFYVASRRRGDKLHYRCGTTGCSTGFLSSAGVPGPLIGQHDHDEEPWIPNRNHMFRTLRERCLAESTSLQVIYNEEALRYPDAAPHLTCENVMASMRKWRRNATLLDIPSCLRDYGAALATRTGFQPMHLATVTAGGATAVVLAMPGWDSCLRDCETVIADGTIETIPARVQAQQLLVLHAIVGSQFFHPVLVLMESRRQVLYEAVLRRVWRAAGAPRPGAVVADYDPALQAALQNVVGAPVSGCYFHFLQELSRQARQCGLTVSPAAAGARLVRLYGALALLPPAAAPPALAALPAAAAAIGLPFNQDFHAYFTDFWMTQIGPELFSVHGQPHRTSNAVESLHIYLRRMLGPSPNVWRFTQVVQQKFEVCVTWRQAQLTGEGATPRRGRAGSLVRRGAAHSNVRALERGRIDMRQFLAAASRAIRLADDSAPAAPVAPVAPAAPAAPDAEVEVLVDDDGPEDKPRAASASPAPASAYDVRCSVCLDDDVQRVLVPCGHILCYECVRNIKRSDTPDKCSSCGETIQMHAVLVR